MHDFFAGILSYVLWFYFSVKLVLGSWEMWSLGRGMGGCQSKGVLGLTYCGLKGQKCAGAMGTDNRVLSR